ncbi:MAG TPA: energy transducer TonB [Chitinispirillaceae bacterium]|nr:energy transducer TonB [Chitinispirillaceae bacterium]
MDRDSQQWLLQFYARTEKKNQPEQFSIAVIFILTSLLFITISIFLKIKNPLPETFQQKIERIQARFVFEQKIPAQIVEKKKPEQEKKTQKIEKKEPLDLTKKTIIEQKPPQQSEPELREEVKKPVRKVYGLKKVYSSGIGASEDASSAIIGKQGNTLDTPIDTFKVTKQELKGQLASITTVTTLPRLKFQVKPEYTKEMLENHIEGVVRVKILIDIDGKVKKAVVLDDLGYGSKQKIYEACLKLEFEPALQGDIPRASWQLIKFRFQMIQG